MLIRKYAQKWLGILIAVGIVVAWVLCEIYGSVDEVGVGNAILNVVIMCSCGIIVIFLKKFEKRYGLQYKGTSLLKTVYWICLHLVGVLVGVFLVRLVYRDGIAATANLVVKAFTRPKNPSLLLFILSLVLFLNFLKKSVKKKLM